ncbi:hypothetical protein T12_12396, partial [Trichinella patagoniensis]
LLLYSYVQRNVSNIVDWLPLILVACALYELRIASCVSTVPLSSSSHNGLCQCSGTISMNLNIFL